jgi:ATP-dependent RNA helicase DDX55/SPB4
MAPENVVAKKAPRAWDALTPPLADWILDAVNSMGYPQATPVQKATFDFFRGNKDVVVEVRFVFLACRQIYLDGS